MKKIIFIATLLLTGLGFRVATAQVRLGINLNIQPQWGPEGYDYVDYYYLPDIDVFYNVPKQQYIYLERGRWTFTRALPYRYNNYDIYNGYKVVVNEPRPYRNAPIYRTKYASFKGNRSQVIIRNSHDSRYFENRNHPEHKQWQKDNNHGNNGRDNGNNNRDKGNKANKGNKGRH